MKMTGLEKEQIVLTKYFPLFKYEGVNEYKMLMSLNKKNKQSSVESYVSNPIKTIVSDKELPQLIVSNSHIEGVKYSNSSIPTAHVKFLISN